ncbi:MAG: ATP-binding protein, partial [Methanothrix sp.]|nr:ATP-binding protein [Methanothrix sp.]
QMKLSYSGYLNRLVAEELLAKTDRSIKHRLRKARFPVLKTIEGFDFTLQPAVNELQIKELAEGADF